MCRLVSVTFIVMPSSSSSSAIVERRFSNLPRSSRCFSSFFGCFFFLKRLKDFVHLQNKVSKKLSLPCSFRTFLYFFSFLVNVVFVNLFPDAGFVHFFRYVNSRERNVHDVSVSQGNF